MCMLMFKPICVCVNRNLLLSFVSQRSDKKSKGKRKSKEIPGLEPFLASRAFLPLHGWYPHTRSFFATLFSNWVFHRESRKKHRESRKNIMKVVDACDVTLSVYPVHGGKACFSSVPGVDIHSE